MQEALTQAAELAGKAAQGDFQSALALARLAAQCPSLPERQSLCDLVRQISHPEAVQVALLYLLSELARRPERGLEVVLRQLESADWEPGHPDNTPIGNPLESGGDALGNLFSGADRLARSTILKSLKESGHLDLACSLPLAGDEWDELWPFVLDQPEILAQNLLRLPVKRVCQGLKLLEESGHLPPDLQPLSQSVPEDLDMLGWATPARSFTLPAQTVPFEKYLSDAPYHDGSDGLIESADWRIRFDENGVVVKNSQGEMALEVAFQRVETADYRQLAAYDRFFDGLSSGQYVANKASSLALSPDGQKLALATLDGGVRIFDLAGRQLERHVFPAGPVSDEAVPVRLRYSGDGQWLAGVRGEHYFLCQKDEPLLLESVRPDLRGLFFRGRALWCIFRDGSVIRLDPTRGEIHQDLNARGVLPALSPDRRCLATFGADHLQLFLLTDHGLAQLTRVAAPYPVRMHFSHQGQALVLRVPDPNKSSSRTALSEMAWRMGHRCLSEWGEADLEHFQTQARLQPHPVWDFLTRLAEVRLARRPPRNQE
ncbi:hypothetical protein IV102_23825 [bacterium]|nr:hypothetical protein [bacterium]